MACARLHVRAASFGGRWRFSVLSLSAGPESQRPPPRPGASLCARRVMSKCTLGVVASCHWQHGLAICAEKSTAHSLPKRNIKLYTVLVLGGAAKRNGREDPVSLGEGPALTYLPISAPPVPSSARERARCTDGNVLIHRPRCGATTKTTSRLNLHILPFSAW